jgi:tetratricopeptide (TPR) repeat protein
MPAVPMIPAHEREHLERATDAVFAIPGAEVRWNRALEALESARVYDAFLEFNELLKAPGLSAITRAHIQLQAVRCLRDAPVERVKTELAFVEPHDAYQTVVLDYRLGWIMRHRLASTAAAHQYFERVCDEARRIGSRTWEVAALLQRAELLGIEGKHDESVDLCNRIYNLSRRNGLVEYIPKALVQKGLSLVILGKHQDGETSLQKAYELACRNELVAEQGMVLHALANIYHHSFNFYGLALEYYDQAKQVLQRVPVWPSVMERIQADVVACQRALGGLDIAKILGPIPINRLRQEYLTSLVNGFVGIPGIENRSQLGERIGLTRQAIHRNINS